MYKLNHKKRVWIVKHILQGDSVNQVALSQKVSRISIFKIMQKYKQEGWESLIDHKTGRSEIQLNKNMEIIILDLRQRYAYGACRIEEVLKKKGFLISHRQIQKLLLRNDLVQPNIKKQKPRKWVRFELPNPNDMWHTDWTYDPYTQQQFSVYIDDRTRLITSYGIFQRATTNNSIALLKTGIANYGKPKTVMTDHGAQFYANQENATQQNTQFRTTLNALGIKHYVARINRPQTNGKVERFFLTYKTEYATGTFTNITDYITHYNDHRPHMSHNYKTPKEIWNELKRC